jgi:filamentous hemagglutinin family protein
MVMQKINLINLVSVSTSTIATIAIAVPGTTQVIPDRSLPENSRVTAVGDRLSIDGGTARGTNLFHSFAEFSVPANVTAVFENGPTVENIFTRVSGGQISRIDGAIATQGLANLFLLNPQGIVFGANARLNVGGSFVATTADRFVFADGSEFGAVGATTATPILTSSVPVGLGFGSPGANGAIAVGGPGNSTILSDGVQAPIRSNSPSGLKMAPGRTLALIGGDLVLDGAVIEAPQGRVELGSIASEGVVSIVPDPAGWAIDYESAGTPTGYGNITLENLAVVDASGPGGGDLQVRGNRILLTDGSQLLDNTLGPVPGGTLSVYAADTLELVGKTAIDQPTYSGLFASSFGPGASPDIDVRARRAIVREGARISASNFGDGPGGDLSLRATDSLEVVGAAPGGEFRQGFEVEIFASSSLNAGAFAGGPAGNTIVETGRLSIRDGGYIATSTFGAGTAGNLTVRARESVEVAGISANFQSRSALASNSFAGAVGNSGELRVETPRLIVLDGAVVSSSTASPGRGANLTAIAPESILVSGSQLDGVLVSGIIASSEGVGPSGEVRLETGRLTVDRGGEVAVSGLGSGDAGRLTIAANEIELNRGGAIDASTVSGQGGNIDLLAEAIALRGGSRIATNAGNTDGGNIAIATDTLIALENSDITANAREGFGGRVEISASGIFGARQRPQQTPQSDITATSELGAQFSGSVNIKTPDVQLESDLESLATAFVGSERVVADSCLARRNARQGRFTVTGTGGLPATPYGAARDRFDLSAIAGVSSPTPTQGAHSAQEVASASPRTWQVGDPIREARGIIKTAGGGVVLGNRSHPGNPFDPLEGVCHTDRR